MATHEILALAFGVQVPTGQLEIDGPLVYWLGHEILILKRGVRLPWGLLIEQGKYGGDGRVRTGHKPHIFRCSLLPVVLIKKRAADAKNAVGINFGIKARGERE